MTIHEFYERYKDKFDNYNVENLVCNEIIEGNIKFIPIMKSYITFLENEREYTKCELIEASSLLHIRRLGLTFEGMNKRELHAINKHSNLSCEKENKEEGYNPRESEKIFKEIYNL